MIALALGLGVLIGLSLDALGGGGSILTVPALVFVLGLSPQQATTGSLVIVGVTATIASIGHTRSGHTRWGRGAVLAVAGLPASLLGSQLSQHVEPDVLLLAFAALMVVAAAGMLLNSRAGPQDAEELPPVSERRAGATHTLTTTASTTTRVPGTAIRIVGAGLVIGFLTGFLGVGGGFVIVPVLVVLLGYEMPVAVGTSLLVIALNSAVALAARAGHGSFVWSVLLSFTAAAVAGSLVGQRIADRAEGANLTRAFAVLLLAVAGYVAVRAWLGVS